MKRQTARKKQRAHCFLLIESTLVPRCFSPVAAAERRGAKRQAARRPLAGTARKRYLRPACNRAACLYLARHYYIFYCFWYGNIAAVHIPAPGQKTCLPSRTRSRARRKAAAAAATHNRLETNGESGVRCSARTMAGYDDAEERERRNAGPSRFSTLPSALVAGEERESEKITRRVLKLHRNLPTG